MLVFTYPHLSPSLEPRRLRRGEIWAVAEEARRQLYREPWSKVDIAQIARRTSFPQVHGSAFEVSRELDQPDIGQLSASK